MQTIPPIIIPQDALINRQRFEDWYLMIANQLFPYSPHEVKKFEIEQDDSKKLALFETILCKVNLVYNGDSDLIDYRHKNRKLSQRKSDVMSTTIYIIRNYYKISSTKLGKLINMNHATVLHHYKKQAAYNDVDKNHRIKYLRLIKHLQDEKIIPFTQEGRPYSKRILSDVLSTKK